jgi:hypothetical protein
MIFNLENSLMYKDNLLEHQKQQQHQQQHHRQQNHVFHDHFENLENS